jgi:hypothetical protein
MHKEARGLLICTENEEANGALVSVRDSFDECGPPIRGFLYYQRRRRRHWRDRLPFHHRGVRMVDVGMRQ